MIISNNTGAKFAARITDKNGKHPDTCTVEAGCYIEFQPRGEGPYTVMRIAANRTSPTLYNVPSPAIVTFWGSRTGGGYSQ